MPTLDHCRSAVAVRLAVVLGFVGGLLGVVGGGWVCSAVHVENTTDRMFAIVPLALIGSAGLGAVSGALIASRGDRTSGAIVGSFAGGMAWPLGFGGFLIFARVAALIPDRSAPAWGPATASACLLLPLLVLPQALSSHVDPERPCLA